MANIIDAKIVTVTDVRPHPNADSLELASAGGWQVCVRKGEWQNGEQAIFICPDSCLPDNREWSSELLRYTGKQNRVKVVKLRGEMSNGILMKIADVESEFTSQKIPADRIVHLGPHTLANVMGITHYVPPLPPGLDAIANGLPFGMEKTDEENWESLDTRELRLGQEALVTRKIDGCSATFIATPNGETWVCGRRFQYSPMSDNRYTIVSRTVLPSLISWAKRHNKTIAARGEITGQGIQSFKINPHCVGPLKFHLFNITLPEESDEALRYGYWGSESHFLEVNKELKLNTVPVLGVQTVTMDLLKAYQQAPASEGEGVVFNFRDGHYKAKSQPYDMKAHG